MSKETMCIRLSQNILLALMAIWVMVSCKKDDASADANQLQYRRTVIVYMAAQNSLGTTEDPENLAIASKLDSAEIAYGAHLLPSTDDNLLLFLDDARAPRLYRYFRSQGGGGHYTLLKKYSEDLSSTSSATLTEVLNLAKLHCPSRSYALVLWSHGLSWLPSLSSFYGNSYDAASKGVNLGRRPESFGIDVGEGGNMLSDRAADGSLGEQMEISDLAQAIEASEVRLDYIFFDACMMQSIEVAYALRHAADYIVGSPALTSGYGCVYYDQMKNGFFAYPSNDVNIAKMVDTYYYDVMEDKEWKERYDDQGCVISAIKTSSLESLMTSTRYYLRKVLPGREELDLSGVDGYIDFLLMGYPDSYDMGTIMHLLLSETDYADWESVLRQCVVSRCASESFYSGNLGTFSQYGKTDLQHFAGVSMFVPQEKYTRYPAFLNYNEAIKSTEWFQQVGWPSE